MTFSIGVVAHRDREAMAVDLAEQVDADLMSIDDGSMGCNTNHRYVWRHLLDSDAEWLIVLEDDALPVPDLRSQLDNILLASPTSIVSLYLGRLRPPHYQERIGTALANAQAQQAHWITSDQCLHAVALAIRYPLVPEMLASLKLYLPIDQGISRWARRRGLKVGYTVPSLVDHADTETLFQHPDGHDRTPGRVAWSIGTRTHWATTAVEM